MKRYLIIFALTMSCTLNKSLRLRNNYTFNDNGKRKMILTFQNDSNCLLKNIYHCSKTDNIELLYNCKYTVISANYILIQNNNKFIDTSGVGFFYFQNTEDLNCDFLRKTEKVFTIGPNYQSDFDKYAKIPFIGIDTLIRNKGQLHWIKKDKHLNVVGYYVFK